MSDNNLATLEPLSGIKHFIKLNARNNHIKTLLDFDPPANLEYADYTSNQIERIENCELNPYLKQLYLDENQIGRIEGFVTNKSLQVLSMRANKISKIENLDDLNIEELSLAHNNLTRITGLSKLPYLRELDLAKNKIVKLKGLQTVNTLRFLNLSLNSVEKILQLNYIELLPLLTELDFCYNPIQNKKHYRS